MLATVQGEGEQPGAVRKATSADGSQQVERLTEADPSEHYYRYVMEDTAMPVTDYSAEFRVRPHGDGASMVEWSADFEVTAEPASQAVDMVQGFLGAGLHSLKERYG
jgi:mxaD protein